MDDARLWLLHTDGQTKIANYRRIYNKFLPSLKRPFICIDALDEFPMKQWVQLWNSLQRVVRECPKTRLVLTGRPQIRKGMGIISLTKLKW